MKIEIHELHPGELGLDEYHKLFRCSETGIAWVEDYSAGIAHSCHPNIAASGSVGNMRRLGYWGKHDRCVRAHGFIFNTSHVVATDQYDELALHYCRCGGKHQ
jgi:hypothetical protein